MSNYLNYSDIYSDDVYDYRHVQMPKHVMSKVQQILSNNGGLLTEEQWRSVGIQMSKSGWVHYAWHKPEPHLLLFRRAKKKDSTPQKDESQEEPSEPEKPRKARSCVKKCKSASSSSDEQKVTLSMKKLHLASE